LSVFDTRTLAIQAYALGHENEVMSIEWNKNGDWLFSGGIDKKLIIWTESLDQIDVKKMPF